MSPRSALQQLPAGGRSGHGLPAASRQAAGQAAPSLTLPAGRLADSSRDQIPSRNQMPNLMALSSCLAVIHTVWPLVSYLRPKK